MFFDFSEYTYFIQPGATDSRKNWGALARIVEESPELDLHSKSMFLFCNGGRNCLKILVWDNGYWVLSKRLLSGTFAWPKTGEEAMALSLDDVKRLISGEDVFRRIPEIQGRVYS